MMVDKEKEEKEEEIRQKVIADIIKYLQHKGNQIKGSEKSLDEQLIQMDVILDVVRFLDKYKENTRILNEHLYKSKFER